MDDLVKFLRHRLDEDERAALAASWDEWDGSHWTAHHREQHDGRWVIIDRADEGVTEVTPQAADDEAVARHIARHDPARAVRSVEAHRGLLKQYEEPETSAALPDSFNTYTARMQRAHLTAVFRHLALAYADHPDYRPAWRP
ncbi:DUF6221 family protein [Streptomyces sp. NPDC059255]|uniref:DUF6221 family protein n=1 Tax=Streptomyces sp. NPDC059255 TaxID=3346793 RepID=UPI0036989B60